MDYSKHKRKGIYLSVLVHLLMHQPHSTSQYPDHRTVPHSPTNLPHPITNFNQTDGNPNSLVNHVWLQNKNTYFINIQENKNNDKEHAFAMLDAILALKQKSLITQKLLF